MPVHWADRLYIGNELIVGGWCNWIADAQLYKTYNTWYSFQWLYINPNENIALTSQFNNTNSVLRKYNYTNKDISTCQIEDNISSWYWRVHCIFANKTWTHIYIWTHTNNSIYEYNTTNWDLDSQHMSLYKSKNFWHIIQSIWISDDERYLIVCNPDDSGRVDYPSEFWLYEMTTPWDLSSAVLRRSWTDVLPYNAHWIFFNQNMTQYVACEYSASSWTVHQWNWDILQNNSTPTETHTFWPVWFTIWYVCINDYETRMYWVKESWQILEYTL